MNGKDVRCHKVRTLLDDGKSWFLESLVYGEEVRVVVVEGIRASEPEDLIVGEHVFKDLYAIEPSPESRRMVVRFSRPVAWQVIDESYTQFDKDEVRDDTGFLRVLERSKYLRYVEANHGWYREMVGPAAHYRLWTEDEVIDVIAHDEPVVVPQEDT